MSKIMVIGGGPWQCPIIKTAKRMGHHVLCTNLYNDSPAFEYADEGRVADVLDKKSNLKIAKEYKPDAVLTDQSDIAVSTVAYISEKLVIKGIGCDVAKRFTNKYYMREYASRVGVSVPDYKLCYSKTEVMEFLDNYDIAIIKPIDNQSSRGVYIIRERNDVEKYFDSCMRYSNSKKAVIVEEFIEGVEFTVDGIKTSSQYEVTAISEKQHYKNNICVANRLFFSNTNDNYDYEVLRKENEEMIQKMGLPFGLTHTEYKYKDGIYYLIETSARGGGTKISSDISRIMSGIDSNRLLINMLLDGSEEIVRDVNYKYAILGFLEFEAGDVVDICGLKDVEAMDGVYEVKLEINVGDTIGVIQDDRSRHGYYILFANSKSDIIKIERQLKKVLRVVTK